jgi:negative regulator of flagellin synthesis FlgM
MSYANGVGGVRQATILVSQSEAKAAIQAGISGAEVDRKSVANVEHADQTSLSSVGGLVAQALEGSDVRSAKVASLQQAIAAGNYSVSSSDVADKVIQSLLE